MKTIVVTGAGGYIGSQVVRELAGRGVQVIAVDRSAGAGPTCACTWRGATGSPTTTRAIWTTFLPTTASL